MKPSDLAAILISHERWLKGIHGGVRADLTLQELYGLDLSEANLKRAKLTGTDLSRCILIKANLEEADLFSANLRECDLTDANLFKADLRGATVRGAKLVRSCLAAGGRGPGAPVDADLAAAIIRAAG